MIRIIIDNDEREVIILESTEEVEHMRDGLVEYERSMESPPDIQLEEVSVSNFPPSVGAMVTKLLAREPI